MNPSRHLSLFTARDLDGFFGLALDNLVQLLTIIFMCTVVVGLPEAMVTGTVLPACAVSIVVGNVFYAWQAHRLARAEGRDDVTALPYGINTVSLLGHIFFVMKPEFDAVMTTTGGDKAAAADAAWKMGCIACLGSGLIEFVGSFVAERLRRSTPRAALLSTLAGIAIGYIAMTFALDIWAKPLVAMPAMAVILLTYFGGVKFPAGLPGGLIAVAVGTAAAWALTGYESLVNKAPGMMNPDAVAESVRQLQSDFAAGTGWRLPKWSGEAIFAGVTAADLLKYAAVIVPMGLFNLIGSLQNIESAEAAGDKYPTAPSLAVNGLGSLVAAALGSPFPTTIYIGHPGWKGLGARAGYSTLNGLFFLAICLTGTVGLISKIIPVEAGYPIVFWIGIVITAQAFAACPARHAPAVAIGLFPGLAAMGFTLVQGAFIAAAMAGGKASLETVIAAGHGFEPAGKVNGFLVEGLALLERGFIFASMILAAVSASLIDRRYRTAAVWSLIGAALTGAGLMHAYQIVGGNGIDHLFPGTPVQSHGAWSHAYGVIAGYVLMAAAFWVAGPNREDAKDEEPPGYEIGGH
jgi:AGZA family xanthine/uracil permease-like MFS transporter